MIYIEIPPGMEYKCVKIGINDYGYDINEDQFVSLTDDRSISIQKAVKTFLAAHINDGLSLCLNMHKKRKASLTMPMLEYRVVQNGHQPTNHAKYINPFIPTSFSSANPLGHPSWWAQGAFLSEESRLEVERKREAQRHNRRHDGDSPMPT